MRSLMKAIALALVALTFAGCGGGGGGGGGPAAKATLTGRILSVETGTATNPKSSIQVGSASVISENDGSFQLDVAEGATSAVVDTQSAWGSFTFTFPAAIGTIDLGDLWVGPLKVFVAGKVVSSVDGSPIEGATVEFAGRRGTTGLDGKFRLANVAYSSATQTVFWGIAGNISAIGFFTTQFSTQPNGPILGTVTVDDIVMTPSSDIDPPPPPFNIWGRITPSASAPGAIATLKLGGVPVRIYNVGSDATYRFWVPAGNYTIEIVKGPLNANATANLTSPDQVIRRDVTIN